MVDDRTSNRNWPLPHPQNKLKDDVERIRQTFTSGDLDIAALLTAVAARSLIGHTHAIADVTNLVTSLAGKAAINHTHVLNDLTDTSVGTRTSGQVLMFSSTVWAPVTLQLGNVTGLETALNARPTTTAMNTAIATAKSELVNGAGSALDTLAELSAALGNDPNFATSMSSMIAARVLTTDYNTAMALKAPLANPNFTGNGSITGNFTVGQGSNATYLYLGDVDESTGGNKSIHANSNQIGFLSGGGGWLARVDNSGNFTATGNSAAYSDRRLKTNVTHIEHALETLLRGQGVMFDRDGQRETGVIAQQFYTAIPELVNRPADPREMWSVKYQNSLGYVIEAFRDVVSQIEALRQEVKILKGA